MNFRFPLILAAALAMAACSSERQGSASQANDMPAAARSMPTATVQGSTAGLAGGPAALATLHRFASTPDRGDLLAYPSTPVVRYDGAYTWHRADVSEAHARAAIGGTLSLRSPSGEQLRFRYERHVEHENGDWTWVGALDGARGREAIITFGAKAAFGTIGQSAGLPLRLTIKDGVAWMIETDPVRLATIENRATRPTETDALLPPSAEGLDSTSGAQPSAAGATAAALDAQGNTVVDLVLGYTPGFVTYYGGESQAQTRLNNMVDITNQAYVNSQVAARVRLVKTLAVNYTELNSNSTALEELTGYKSGTGGGQTTPNAAFSALRQARETYGADVVSLVRRFYDPEHDGCGIAWLIGGGRDTVTQSDEYFGYSVVSDGRDQGTDGKTYFCREETLAHELGHNMGAAHDRATSMGSDNTLQNNEYGAFTYSFGYKTTATNGNFYTVMAYGDSGQTSYRVFSNPRTTMCGGLACGVENEADNARTLTQTIPTIATFRAAKVADTPPAVRKVARDLNGDGMSDIVWQNTAGGQLGTWLMNGTTLAVSQNSGSLPAGTSAIAIGDFNGDGFADVMSVASQTVYVSMGAAGGVLGTPVSVSSRPPAGWNLAGAGDVNGDGKA
ncbi:reprolysin-like metallopeptidase, partial [Cognatilysobacter segetis]|uniref:reprolysin-like metallopeptidase n=1 Tax=Cognatilysobacter segetis TaxID=2492394 RepID=UPI00192E46BD